MRILVVQTAFLGDLVLTTPLLRELKRRVPAASIEVLTTPLGLQVFSGLPFVREVLLHDKRGGLRAIWRTGRALRARRFDVAIAAHRSHRSALLLRLSGAPSRIGFSGSPGAWAYVQRVERDPARHAIERYLALASPLDGCPGRADPRPLIRIDDGSARRAERLLLGQGVAPGESLLCLAPGSIWGTKRWLPEGFAAVAAAARQRGLRPILVGSSNEIDLCRRVARQAGSGVVQLAGRTGIKELAKVLRRSLALISNDSGPAHVASAVGTPVLSIFGPTVPSMGYAPHGAGNRVVEQPSLSCRPCHHHGPQRCPLGHFRCMNEIEPATVIRQLDQLLHSPSHGVAHGSVNA